MTVDHPYFNADAGPATPCLRDQSKLDYPAQVPSLRKGIFACEASLSANDCLA